MRGALAAAVAFVILAAGCAGGPTETATPTETASATPTPTTTDTATRTLPPQNAATDEPEPWHAVTVANDWSRNVTVTVRVIRVDTVDADETVHEAAYNLTPGESSYVYDTASADPEGVERFRVVATAGNRTAETTVETNACHGDVVVTVRDDGTLYAGHGVC